jgi:hypothetical protein
MQYRLPATLAAQMVGLPWLTMDLLRKANDHARLNDAGNLAIKLLRTFTARLEALKRYRSAMYPSDTDRTLN